MVAGRELIVAGVGGHPLAQLLRRCMVTGGRRDLEGGALVRAIRDARVRSGVGEQRLDDSGVTAERSPRERGLPVSVDGVDLELRMGEQPLDELLLTGERRR